MLVLTEENMADMAYPVKSMMDREGSYYGITAGNKARVTGHMTRKCVVEITLKVIANEVDITLDALLG